MKIDADNLHVRNNKKHRDCDWYDEKNMECTNWGEFIENIPPAYVECYAPIGSIFKEVEK